MAQNFLTSDVEDSEFIDITGDSANITELQNDIDSQMNRIFEEFGGDPTDTEFNIHVKRVMPGRGELEHCFSCLPHELPITDRIKNEWGPGEYSVWIYKDKKIWKRRKMNIAKALDKPVQHNDLSSGGGLKDILSAMQANQERQWQQMQDLMLRQNQQPNQMDQMTNMLNMMALMKQVMGEPAKPQDPMKTIELAKSLAEMMGDSGDKSSLDRLIEQALPALIEGAKQAPNQQLQPTLHPQLQPQVQIKHNPISVPIPPDPPNQSTITTQKEENPEMMITAMVKSKLPELINWASQEKDPELYAEFVLDNIPDMFLDKYCDFVKSDDCLQQLIAIDKNVNKYTDWFTHFRLASIDMINDDLTKSDLVVHDFMHVSKPDIDGKSEAGAETGFTEDKDTVK